MGLPRILVPVFSAVTHILHLRSTQSTHICAGLNLCHRACRAGKCHPATANSSGTEHQQDKQAL